jgi:adenylosuccinate lyase
VIIKTADLFSLSAVDGRYSSKTAPLAHICSEGALITNRVRLEVLYLLALSDKKIIRNFTSAEKKNLNSLTNLTPQQILKIKKIEDKTHHDVKAVEYFLREKIKNSSLHDISSFIHFGLTSEDINNLAYRIMMAEAIKQIILPELIKLTTTLTTLAETHQAQPMLARTHGQPAIPTTFGKELAVFINRLLPLLKQIKNHQFEGKLNGAVGGYHALVLAYPKVNWLKFSQDFVESLGFKFLPISTQINPQDDLVELFQKLQHLNQILIGLNQDFWRYISDDWLTQKNKQGQVGSSTMPQKINPIDFENSEGNLKLANGLFTVFIQNFPISRLQRDLSDSTIYRNMGLALGHCLLSYKSLNRGLASISVNHQQMEADLTANWNVLAEAAQTMARKNGDDRAYEKIAKLSKNKIMDEKMWKEIAAKIDPDLGKLTPQNYLGLSKKLTKKVVQKSYQLIKEINP